MDFFSENRGLLSAFSDMSRAVGARADYVQGGGGNTSVKLNGGLMAIKGSGYRLSDIAPDAAYAVLKNDDILAYFAAHETAPSDAEAAGSAAVNAARMEIDGLDTLRPSVEAGFHALLDRFVVHSHSAYANLACCAAECGEIAKRALSDADYGYAIIPYTDPGIRLGFMMREALETHGRPAVLLLKNHGVVVHADTAERALAIHEDVNRRFAAAFGLGFSDFPTVGLSGSGDTWRSDTPYSIALLASGAYPLEFLLKQPLYPDQLVFFTGTLVSGAPAEGECSFDGSGRLCYRMRESKALAIEQTMAAVLFICETLKKNGCTFVTLGEEAKRFIANWESEKYRKSLA